MFTVFVNRFFLMTGKIYAKQFWFLALYLTACLAACTANKQTAATAQEKQPVYTQTTLEAAPGDSLIIKRKKLIDGALKQNKPVILLTDNVDEKQIFAQHIALQNNAFAQYMRSQNNEPFLNEIFGVLKSPPGNQLEALSGNRKGQHSIRVNQQWRVCFVWTAAGPADVEIVDYH